MTGIRLATEFLGNPLSEWLSAAVIFLAVLGILWLARRLVSRHFARLARSTETVVDDVLVAVLESTRSIFLLVFAVWAGLQSLRMTAGAQAALTKIGIVVVLYQIGVWVTTFGVEWLRLLRQKREKEGEVVAWFSAVEWAGRVVIWSVLLLVGLEKLGANISSLVTGLGIGGIAVALAVQSILGDLFSAFSIFVDRPFTQGDFLMVGDLKGTVEDIGFKTTRLRSLTGEQLVFANSDLVGSRIRNFGRLVERRVQLTIGVTYDTPREKVRRIPPMIQEVVESHDRVRFDRSHFKEFGDSALLIETVYHILEPSFEAYMDVQQGVNLEVMKRFEAEGIEFAYPTQTILVRRDSEAGAAGSGPGPSSH